MNTKTVTAAQTPDGEVFVWAGNGETGWYITSGRWYERGNGLAALIALSEGSEEGMPPGALNRLEGWAAPKNHDGLDVIAEGTSAEIVLHPERMSEMARAYFHAGL